MNKKRTFILLVVVCLGLPVVVHANQNVSKHADAKPKAKSVAKAQGQSHLNNAALERALAVANTMQADTTKTSRSLEPTQTDSEYNPSSISSVQQQLADETARQIQRSQDYLPSGQTNCQPNTVPTVREQISAEEAKTTAQNRQHLDQVGITPSYDSHKGNVIWAWKVGL